MLLICGMKISHANINKIYVKYFGECSKQPPEVLLCKKKSSQEFSKFDRKAPMLESLFNKIAGLKVCNFI